ncbi:MULTISPECIES: MBL fold metallo-hydrolase RNA specificity domain-containing protein [unclassified Arenibacter]|uniref:MBL fold metallo-hydrolase RNA specificity domain-containing protein n=1 Tax=unclassified Arenibacter TaxID=2615047 RepID=UPI000E345A99|nr:MULTISPECIES: MBL fold metallo-hydrolase [unclassified Arenibacter]MCM4163437.1 MBL fold metallo-hydrolase [Arenibacter sp. A80]RFT57435.1 MBL fold metallo-hydrolase [Arenibacter sp. P308M17]
MNTVKIHFLGASGTVTGSKFYLETPELNIMVDCGLFQGLKELRQQNWIPLPIDASKIDLVLLTHGHLDHTGYLPRLLKEGFKGKIIGTAPTLAVTRIILLDSAKIHEEEAEQANKEGYSKHSPALAFYTIKDAERTIDLFESREKEVWITLSDNIRFKFRYNGHIIGATFIELEIFGKLFVFSGDIGRLHDDLLEAPERPKWADYLFLESTYGNKLHPEEDVEGILGNLIKTTIRERGNLIIPSFAVERLQSLMYLLWRLYKKNRIPNIPIFIDSPMGNNVLSVFEQFPHWHKMPMNEYKAMCSHFNIITSYADTWKTIDDPRSKIVIAGSGMVTGGRVLTYLKQWIDLPSTFVLLVGFQAEGTRGRQLLEGAYELKLFGKYYPVKGKVHHLESLSAHADQSELLHWMEDIENIPETVFLIHGEPTSLDAFRVKIRDVLGWNVQIPKLSEIHQVIV